MSQQDNSDEPSFQHLQAGRSRAALRGVLWATVNSLAPIAVGVLVFAITSRYLSPAQFGLVALAASFGTVANALAPAAFGLALVQKKDIDSKLLDTIFWFCLATSILLYGALALAAVPISRCLNEDALAPLILVIGLKVIFDLVTVVPNALLVRSMSFNLMAIRTTAASLIAAAACLVLLWLGYGVWALAMSQLVTSVAICVGTLMSASWRPNFRFSTQSLKDVSRFGLYASGNRVIQIMSIDQILIGTLMGPAPLGIFGFSKRIFQMLNDVIAGVLNSVSYALLSSLQTEKEKLREAFLIVTFASSAFSFPLFIGLASVSNDLVPLVFGPQWLEAVPSLQGFCVLGLLSCIGVLQSTLINSQGRADWWLYYVAAKQVLTIAIILYFYRYGVTAMVIAIAIQNFVMWPAAVHLVLKVLGMTMSRYLAPFIGPSLATLGMFLYILLMQNLLSSWTPLSRLPLIIISAALVYTVILGVYDRRRVKDMYLILRKRGKA